ncbi:MAG: hypothetical protein UV60_C0042G0009 [Parcubacteria group bacterium GW2011_GWA2_43_11]|nr:MAG: hypothetical protein UV60_C0042G0009 [Parcubacteria group bacterium GW2011_GWA2_43_11]
MRSLLHSIQCFVTNNTDEDLAEVSLPEEDENFDDEEELLAVDPLLVGALDEEDEEDEEDDEYLDFDTFDDIDE